MKHHKLQHLPRNYNNTIVFELLLINHSIGNDTNIGAMEGMNTKIDGHPWTKSNAYNKVDIPKNVCCRKKFVWKLWGALTSFAHTSKEKGFGMIFLIGNNVHCGDF